MLNGVVIASALHSGVSLRILTLLRRTHLVLQYVPTLRVILHIGVEIRVTHILFLQVFYFLSELTRSIDWYLGLASI